MYTVMNQGIIVDSVEIVSNSLSLSDMINKIDEIEDYELNMNVMVDRGTEYGQRII